jgi:hypothetical protein
MSTVIAGTLLSQIAQGRLRYRSIVRIALVVLSSQFHASQAERIADYGN